jgi:fructose-1,6-bisphosphatase/inositol monophosphatase family enzyme
MRMTDYIQAVKRDLRDQHGFTPCPGSSKDELLFDNVPDGEYPMTINGRLDYGRLDNGSIHSLLQFQRTKNGGGVMEEFEKAMIEAVWFSMRVIRDNILGLKVKEAQTKGDGSLLTRVDLESEQAGFRVLQEHFPGIPVLREESGLSKGSGRWVFLYDPIDGTRPFLSGTSTSTVICALYDRQIGAIMGVVIGDPSYGRVWSAFNGAGCKLSVLDMASGSLLRSDNCLAWQGDLQHKSLVLYECSHAFSRGNRQILTDENVRKLHSLLQPTVTLQNYGSNGLHHALVANGADFVGGAITVAMGGPWDCGGVIAVLEAGGICAAFRMTYDRQLEPREPLDPFSYDILVVANKPDTLLFLCDCLLKCLR